MSSDLYHMRWHRFVGGYFIVEKDINGEKQAVLTRVPPIMKRAQKDGLQSKKQKTYDEPQPSDLSDVMENTAFDVSDRKWHLPVPYYPLENKSGPTILKEFLRISSASDPNVAVLKFVNHYGFLGISKDRNQPLGYGDESIADWIAESKQMSNIYRLWNLPNSGNKSIKIPEGVRWDGKDGLILKDKNRKSGPIRRFWKELDDALHPDIFRNQPQGKLLKRCLSNERDAAIEVGEALIGALDYKLSETILNPRITLSGKGGLEIPRLQFSPARLIDLIWLQFARALARNRSGRLCENCGNPLSLSTERVHASRRYCGNTCRIAAYRARRGSHH